MIFVDEPDDIVTRTGPQGRRRNRHPSASPPQWRMRVYHATGRRLRDFPLTVDKLLG
ncbi:hypothetical protein ACPA9J_33710 [Pseudomonas aeruginosa]